MTTRSLPKPCPKRHRPDGHNPGAVQRSVTAPGRVGRPGGVGRTVARIAGWLLVVGSASLGTIGRLEAAPYYTVTPLGGLPEFNKDASGVTQSFTVLQTGVTYPFVTTTTPPTAADLKNLPGGTVTQGTWPYLQQLPFTMSVSSINTSGTAIGGIPSGYGSDPWQVETLGYAVRSPDGQFSPFISLLDPTQDATSGALYLSQSNKILIFDYAHVQTSLFDVATGTTTPISQLFPPEMLQQLLKSSFDGSLWYDGTGLDDRGDILVWVGPTPGQYNAHMFIFTPPGLAPPTPTPEPSSLWIFGLIASAAGLRVAIRRP